MDSCFRFEGLEVGCSRAVCYSLDSYEFLLDPNGVILAVGLEGEALQQKLDEILK